MTTYRIRFITKYGYTAIAKIQADSTLEAEWAVRTNERASQILDVEAV